MRDVNERIRRGTWADEQPGSFRCECGTLSCDEIVELPVGEYKRIRSDPKRFVIVPGHEEPEVEDIVEAHDDHVLVRKRGKAGAIAEATAPPA
ncbi:MAG TPA: hypothetical protein VGN08_13555 [Solirubrobacteraceae bacterium]|jgi:hypothetical protein